MISKDEILHVAALANLKFQDDEVDSFVNQLDKIVNMESKLSSVDTTGIKPTYNMGDTNTVFREDKGVHTQTREQMLENVPEVDNNLIKVPTIVDKEDDE
ncbi:aspartyl/glutamyl-tRNA(Asn/Gln) amidotransferase subunit C [Companilactobacillus crustorum]|uniref:Aspartyl/glutamyl-tRNA(Asn/Gln) amidotransferase subunit C n=3 Tax=Companilactobacillus TaxID=2767879 RepID=A0A837RIR3_9LACO|nr:Asp-tRNA(Asn)/Glu-tRNA(Gln) amidotransferase subunit GatC [Companilactobacillus crustorum]HCD07787.1 Asp-tRNA(Asn)/Glu-tRNA(Gln) amidotransferase subunit GatC [Lactobacillus sp.]APU72022.1 Aspartyl/glutamyl-tRNA(Asn/Gln) amidotransferase subunit C [Companilactobacillus crustorum]KRK42546.1 aspartyl glutamyl-tRNA(Asn Gln) amidotransferase subunit C [Companilactobacillus crustorum JCM 15951]KRO20327.1 aspartyl glutamyl-tRNA(Asn Gln) amidotransferase subunit C [Companilactobacillus crustorum]W